MGPAPRSVQKVSRECPRSVKKVSRTLRGHSRDTFTRGAGPKGPSGWGHLPGHSVGHPDFREHSVRHSRGHSGPKGPRNSCRGPTMSQYYSCDTPYPVPRDTFSGRSAARDSNEDPLAKRIAQIESRDLNKNPKQLKKALE